MPVKSIIDVGLQLQRWEQFQQEFDRYSEALRKQPALWKQISAEHSKLAGGFAKLGGQMDAHFGAANELKDLGDEQEQHLTRSASLWGDIEKSSGHTAKNVIGATTSLLKWTGLLSGAAGLLGYFSLGGMEDLGRDVYGWRKSAMGLGLTTGQQRAFDISFGPLLGSPQGFLGGINTAVTNYAAQGPLYALGVNPNQSTSQVAVATLEALRRRVAGMSVPMLGQFEQAYGLGALGIGVEDLRRLQSMSGGQFGQLLGTYQTEQKAMNIAGQAWQNFWMKMQIAGSNVQTSFANALTNLTGPLSNVANSFSNLLNVVAKDKNGGVAKAINSMASLMNDFAADVSSPNFLSGVKAADSLLKDLFSTQSASAVASGLGATK